MASHILLVASELLAIGVVNGACVLAKILHLAFREKKYRGEDEWKQLSG